MSVTAFFLSFWEITQPHTASIHLQLEKQILPYSRILEEIMQFVLRYHSKKTKKKKGFIIEPGVCKSK